MFRWLDQKSTMTSNSWRLLHVARRIAAFVRSYIRSQEPPSVSHASCTPIVRPGMRSSRKSSTNASLIELGSSCLSSHLLRPMCRMSFCIWGVMPQVARRSRCRSGSAGTNDPAAAAGVVPRSPVATPEPANTDAAVAVRTKERRETLAVARPASGAVVPLIAGRIGPLRGANLTERAGRGTFGLGNVDARRAGECRFLLHPRVRTIWLTSTRPMAKPAWQYAR